MNTWQFIGRAIEGTRYYRVRDIVVNESGRFHCYFTAWATFCKFAQIDTSGAA